VEISPAAAREADAVGVPLHRLIAGAADTALERLPHRGRVTIRVDVDASQTIPGAGVGGFTRGTGDVDIFIAAYPVGLRKKLTTWIPLTIAHELHHSSRIRTGPGYGRTLADALVAEGLADRFAATLFPDRPPAPWDHALTRREEQDLWKRARAVLFARSYDHGSWFFGTGELPRWTGYTVGYDLVERYLRSNPSRSGAADVPTSRVLAAAVLPEARS
jgi:hypothetical protein